MKRTQATLFSLLFLSLFLITSCAVVYPNQKLIIGRWKTESVEKYIDPHAAPAVKAETHAAQPVKARPSDTTNKPGGSVNAQQIQIDQRKVAMFERFIRSEERSTLEVSPSGTAAKFFPGKSYKLKWKMKSKGMRVSVKDFDSNRKFDIDILEITDKRLVIIEHTELGDLKIVYSKEL